MRKLFADKRTLFVAIIIFFILGQVAGTFAIKGFFIDYKIKELKPIIESIATEIAGGNKLSKTADFMIKAYDIYGKEMDVFMEEEPQNLDIVIPEAHIYSSLADYIPKVIAGNETAAIRKINGQSLSSILIGTPILKDNQVIGALFLMMPESDFNAVLNGFYLVFSITLILGTIIIGVFLQLYLKEVKRIEQTRRDYIANVSHELKSPIASIKALAETLYDQVITEETDRNRYYDIILKESNNLEHLITDMLELSRLQSGRSAFHKENLQPSLIMEELKEKYITLLSDMNILFEITEAVMALPSLHTNKDRLLQLFTIFIDNSIKFVGDNGRILIDAKVQRGVVRFSVSDNGIGIKPSELPYIFERFYKGDTAPNKSGSGLSLSIAKEIITALNEKIWVTSEYGKGTEVNFTIHRN